MNRGLPKAYIQYTNNSGRPYINTLAALSNTRRVEPYMKALWRRSWKMVGVMSVVYSNDGSSKSWGLCCPMSHHHMHIICSESRDTLAELTKLTLEILAAASGYKYSCEGILK